MKTLFNIVRAVIYIVAIAYLIPQLFYSMGWFGMKVIIFINYLHSSFSFFVFWLILCFVGIGLIRLAWSLFQIIAAILVWFANYICPYLMLKIWGVIIITGLSFLAFVYGYWSDYGWPSLMEGVVGICISFAALTLSGVILNITYSSIKETELE